MDSKNNKEDVELAKKGCEKAREIIKSKRSAALALLASIGICLTLVVMTFVIGSLFGYYLANVQMLRIEQNVENVKEGKTETNFTIGEMQKLTQQLEHKVENNQTTISTTTQISTTTSTTTDEDLTERRPHLKIRISFDTDENEETQKENVDPKVNQMDEIIPIWNEIIETLEPLEPRELLERTEPDDPQQISTNTSTPATDEESTGSKNRISFDSDENDEKVNVNPKEDRMDGENISSWDEILVNSGILEKLEPDSDAQPISTSTSNPEDLTQIEFGHKSIFLKPVFIDREKNEPEDYDNANNDQEDDNVEKESISLKITEPNFSKTTTPKPNTLKVVYPSESLDNINERIPIEWTNLYNKYVQFMDILRCPGELARQCSAPAHRQDIEEQRKHMESIVFQEFKSDEDHQLTDSAQIENAHRQLDATFERIRRTPVDLCADHYDYDKCQSCVQQNADCSYSFKNICKTQIEWNIIGYTPKLVHLKQCYTEDKMIFRILYGTSNAMRTRAIRQYEREVGAQGDLWRA